LPSFQFLASELTLAVYLFSSQKNGLDGTTTEAKEGTGKMKPQPSGPGLTIC
jgi:hypothetical protein